MAYDPLEVFPLPVWECILEKLRIQGSSSDVLNCSKVCTEFQRILEPTKREWLFGSICPFIFPYLKGCQFGRRRSCIWLRNIPYREGSDLLACRQVCKNWRLGVDNFLEEFETWRPFNEETSDISRPALASYDPLLYMGIKGVNIWDEPRLDNFLEAMKKKEMRVPFVGRSLDLKDGNQYFEKTVEMFSLYGDYIWHLRVTPAEDPWQYYQKLKQILGCTPNLRSLSLNLFFSKLSDSESGLLLEGHPLTDLISLETLEVDTAYTPAVVVLEKLMSTINLENLKCLTLHHYCRYNVEFCSVVRPFQHLTELHVSGIKWDDLKHLFNNISPTAPLAKLSLRFGLVSIEEIDLDRVCNMISRWKRTLRMLAFNGMSYMDTPPKLWEREPSMCSLSPSNLDALNLKSLELEDIMFRAGYLPHALTASLEYLNIGYSRRPTSLVGTGLQIYQCVIDADELHNSSIWSEMKKLKVIRVCQPAGRVVICTREMYERGILPKLARP